MATIAWGRRRLSHLGDCLDRVADGVGVGLAGMGNGVRSVNGVNACLQAIEGGRRKIISNAAGSEVLDPIESNPLIKQAGLLCSSSG
jgi:hypothetical protein